MGPGKSYPPAYIEEEESQYPLVSDDVEDVASAGIDNGKPVDSVRNQRMDRFKQRCIWMDDLQRGVILLENACDRNSNT